MPQAKIAVESFINSNNKQDIINGLRQNAGIEYKDNNGNKRLTSGRWIKYDYDNRPIKIITEDGTETKMQYDYEGQRVLKTVVASGSEATSLYIGTIYEENYTGNVTISTTTTKYIFAGGQRVALIKDSGETNYFLTDHLGSTNKLTDSTGNVDRTTLYTPFGSTYSDVVANPEAAKQSHLFTGQIADDNTGLYYYNARYYDPILCTFISADPIVQAPYNPQSLNRYTYCLNNPINLIDPSGNAAVYLGLERRGDSFKHYYDTDKDFREAHDYLGDGIYV